MGYYSFLVALRKVLGLLLRLPQPKSKHYSFFPYGLERPDRRKLTRLGEVCRNELGHLKHGDLTSAAEDLLKILVCIDVPLVLAVLETVLLDVDPELLC